MTVKEAVLKSLKDIDSPSTYKMIYRHIVDNNYYDFHECKTPEATVSAILGDFIRYKDKKIKRVKTESNKFLYSFEDKE